MQRNVILKQTHTHTHTHLLTRSMLSVHVRVCVCATISTWCFISRRFSHAVILSFAAAAVFVAVFSIISVSVFLLILLLDCVRFQATNRHSTEITMHSVDGVSEQMLECE